MAAKFFDKLFNLLNYIPKSKQVLIEVPDRNLEDQKKQPRNFIRATVAKIYLALKRFTESRNFEFEEPDVKMTTIKNALKVETYLRRGRDRYTELIWKNGFEFIGDNRAAVKYIKRRFKEIAYISQKPTMSLFEEITEQLVSYYNVMIVKIRNNRSSSGRSRKFFGKVVKPVAGYFTIDVTRTRAMLDDKTRQLEGYEYDDEVEWEPHRYSYRDIIHVSMSVPPGKVYGDPATIPVINDIRALRRMEENVEILVFQHSIPLFHYTVGTEEKPAQDGEVDSIKVEVENMVTQGMLVTPERHTIKAIGVQREALNVSEYLAYFKTRILTGLGHSTISIGESGGVSRATAGILSKAVIDSAIKFKNKIKTYVDEYMIDELLQEGGFDVFDIKNKVEIFIPEIDLDDKIRKEFHTIAKWEASLITEDEARSEIGKDPYTNAERRKTYFELITKPRMIIQAIDEPFLSTATSNKERNNREVPQNQYGSKKTGPTQRTGGDSTTVNIKDSFQLEELKSVRGMYLDMFSGQYNAAQEDIYSMIDEKSFNSGKIALNMSKKIVAEKGSVAIVAAYKQGIKDAGYDPLIPIEADLKMVHGYHVAAITNLFDSLLEKIDNSNKTKTDVISIFETNRYRVGFIVDWHIKKSYWLAIASSKKTQGYKSINVKRVNPDTKDKCYTYPDVIDLSSQLYIYQVPPHHSGCECFLEY